MFKLNNDMKTRDQIIFGEVANQKKYFGGIERFENLSVDALKELVEKNFIELEERQNECPSTKAILSFMEKYDGYVATGYAVTIKRDDYRVTLDGISKDSPSSSKEELKEFSKLFRYADEFEVADRMYCWFD